MANAEAKQSFPYIPAKSWWDLRRKFQQSIPKLVTNDYLVTAIGISEASAAKLVTALRVVELIDADGKPTDLAKDWRDDAHYKSACDKMVASVYPAALKDAVSDPVNERDSVQKWFMRNADIGEVAAKQATAFYVLLSQGDPAQQAQAASKANGDAATKTPRQKTPRSQPASTQPVPAPQPAAHGSHSIREPKGPALHIDIQVHIAADAKPDQIDQIFASMAKHLYAKTHAE